MRVFDSDPQLRWLFCLTHPDDEIAICAWIRVLASHGVEVFLSWTHDTPVREAEARAAADRLGVPQDRLFFHHAQDGLVLEELAVLKAGFQTMMKAVQADRVACGAFEHGHLDHDATNFLVNHTFGGVVLEFPLYHPYLTWLQTLNRFSDPTGEEVLRLTPEERRFKSAFSKHYPSQNIRRVLVWYEVYRAITLRPPDLRDTERMRVQTHKDFLTPNAPPRLAARIQASPQWRRWCGAVAPHLGVPDPVAARTSTL
jgi:LmbE family N-acetylglucosaminyl deacetylase